MKKVVQKDKLFQIKSFKFKASKGGNNNCKNFTK